MSNISILVKKPNGGFEEKAISDIQTGTNQISLQQGELLKVGVTPDQIQSISQEGNNLVIRLKDGSQIMVENYNILTDPQIVLGDGSNLWMAEATQGAGGELVINYNPTTTVVGTSGAASSAAISATALKIGLGLAAIGGIAAAASGGGASGSAPIDREPPEPGALNVEDFLDTGRSNTDKITQDTSFKLVLNGQEPNALISYWVSKDQGETWQETTSDQQELLDGSYQYKAIVKDQAGNQSETEIVTVVIDTTPPPVPALILTEFNDTGSSDSDGVSQDKSFKLSVNGVSEDIAVEFWISKDGESWEVTISDQTDLPDGIYQYKAVLTDLAGNTSETAVKTVTIDTTAPVAGTLAITDFNDTGSSASDKISQDKNFKLSLSGQEAGSTVQYLVSNDQGATWQATTAEQSNLADGIYQFKAVVTDVAGNTDETAIQTITVDTTAPVAGTLAITEFEDTGSSASDKITQDKNFKLSLSGQEAGSNVQYLVSKDQGATWQATTAEQSNMADGIYQFKAVVTDVAGNTAETAIQTITVDTTAPVAGTLTITEFNDSGSSATDKISNDHNFKLGVTGQEAGSTVQYLVSNDQGATWQETTAEQSNLADGIYQFKAVVTDVAGNTDETAIQTITVDTTAPVAGTLAITEFEDTGSSASDKITQDKNFKLSLSGQEAGSNVQYLVSKDQGATWQATTAEQSNLADGIYQFKAVVTDVAGNTAETAIQTITVDTTAPVGTLAITEFNDSGSSATDKISNDHNFKLGVTGQEAGSTVQYLVSKDQGATWQATTAEQSNMADGIYQFKAVVTDVAGNTAETAIQTITVDTTAPVAGTLAITEFEDTGSSASDKITQDKNFKLSLSGQEAGSNVQYLVSKDQGATWQATTAEQSNLADGIYQFKAVVTDVAGNSAETAAQTITVDTVANTGQLNLVEYDDTGASQSDFISQDNSFKLEITGQEAGAIVQYLISTDQGVTWQTTTAEQANLADGIYQFKAVVTDVAGNTAETAIQTITVDTTVPPAATLNITDFEDTGLSSTDKITQDKSFTFTIGGQEAGTTVQYFVSKDGGGTWQETSAAQNDLNDGSYQFKAVVTDKAGNQTETAIQNIVVDNTAPIAGSLAITEYLDTGDSGSDQISQGKSFKLNVSGAEAGTTISYWMSKDGGTWQGVSADQTDLDDGVYQFKAVVTDVAGNTSETAIQSVTVDTTAPAVGTLSISDYDDTGSSTTDQISQDKSFQLGIHGQEAGTTVQYLVSKDQGASWQVTSAEQTNLNDGTYQFKAVITDIAGNQSETNVETIIVDTTAPQPGSLILSDYEDTGVSATDYISQDKNFTLGIIGQEAGTTVQYYVSSDAGLTWAVTNAQQSNLADGVYQFKAVVTDIAGNSSETAVQTITVDTTISEIFLPLGAADTGISDSDFITQSNTFTLALQGDDFLSDLTEYLVSKDGGPWQTTTAAQSNLADGVYQFKAMVTDVAGNIAETQVQTITIDNTPPVPGQIMVNDYQDTGRSGTDFISQDKSFSLNIAGQEADTTVQYLISTNQGVSWQETTIEQTDLADGEYYFKAVVTDIAGNTAETAVQKMTVDTTAPAPGQLVFENFVDTGRSTSDLITQDHSFNLNVIGHEADAIVSYFVSQDQGQTWQATVAEQQNLADGTYQFKAVITDVAGNESELVKTVVVDNQVTATWGLKQFEDTGKSGADYITQDHTFELGFANEIYEGVDISYEISVDGGTSWTSTTKEQVSLADGTYLYRATVKDLAGNIANINPLGVTVDTTSPQIGELEITQLRYTGSTSDQISSDNKFNLALTRQEPYTDLVYQISSDGGQTWTNTTADQNLADGTYQFKAVVTDIAGNVSTTNVEEVTIDTTALGIESIQFVPDFYNNLKVKLDADDVYYGALYNVDGRQVGWSYTTIEDHTINFDLSGYLVDPAYKLDQGIKVVLYDKAGNTTETFYQIPVDTTAPNPIQNFSFEANEDWGGFNLSGKVDENVKLLLVTETGRQIYAGNLYSSDFNVWVDTYYAQGETVNILLEDPAGNRTVVDQVLIPADDDILPAPDQVQINADGTVVSGYAEPGSRIVVLDEQGSWINNDWYNSFADSTGYFEIAINLQQLLGQPLFVAATDWATGKAGSFVEISAPLDSTPPTVSILSIDQDYISAQSEAGVKVRVLATDGTVIEENIYVDASGYFDIYMGGKHFWLGEDLIIEVTDKNYNVTSETVHYDFAVDAPAAPTDVLIQDNGFEISGKAEPNTTVYVFDQNQQLVSSYYTYSQGEFSGYLDRPYLNGETLYFKTYNGSYSAHTVITAPVDTTPPEIIEELTVITTGTYFFELTGQAEKYATIELFVNGQLINSQRIWNDDGKVTFTLLKEQYTGEQIRARVIDENGRSREFVTIDLPNDVTPPKPVSNLGISAGTLYGQMEQDAYLEYKVVLKNGQSFESIAGYSYLDGTFSVGVSYASPIDYIEFIVKDYAGNYSTTTVVNYEDIPEITEDVLAGTAGDDVFIVDAQYDFVKDYAVTSIDGQLTVVDNGGYDRVESSVSYDLSWTRYDSELQGYVYTAEFVEELKLVGQAAINAYGNEQDNILIGNDANNILNGRWGNDTYIGGAGSDTVQLYYLTGDGTTAGNGHDVWEDFTLGDTYTDSQADKVDLTQLLYNYSPDKSVDNFIKVTTQGSDTVISVDIDGADGNAFVFSDILTLKNVNTSLEELINNHQLKYMY